LLFILYSQTPSWVTSINIFYWKTNCNEGLYLFFCVPCSMAPHFVYVSYLPTYFLFTHDRPLWKFSSRNGGWWTLEVRFGANVFVNAACLGFLCKYEYQQNFWVSFTGYAIKVKMLATLKWFGNVKKICM